MAIRIGLNELSEKNKTQKWIVYMRTVNVRVRLFNLLVSNLSNSKWTTTPTIFANTRIVNGNISNTTQ